MPDATCLRLHLYEHGSQADGAQPVPQARVRVQGLRSLALRDLQLALQLLADVLHELDLQGVTEKRTQVRG